MPTRPLIAGAATVLTLAAVGCGSSQPSAATETSPAGDIPDNQAYVAYTPPGGGYSVKVPEGWARTVKGGAVTFSDKLNAIRMESAPAGGPLSETRAAGQLSGAQHVQVSTVSRKAGNAVLATYLTAAKPDAVTGKAGTDAVERYVFFHSGRRVVLTLTGPKGADNVDPWRIVTDSLQWKR